MTAITAYVPNTCQYKASNELEMAKRLIAALLLASLSCWSAPVAIAASGPVRSHQPSQKSSESHAHDCCPSLGSQLMPAMPQESLSSGMPCDDQHPCCAKQGPQNSPLLPAPTRPSRLSAGGAPIVAALNQSADAFRSVFSSSDRFRFHSVRSTVLRI